MTRGLIELVDHTHEQLNSRHTSPTSVVVHCNLGSDRSSLFVGLSILVQQLRTEQRVDIFTTTRKLRSQRHSLISTYVSTVTNKAKLGKTYTLFSGPIRVSPSSYR